MTEFQKLGGVIGEVRHAAVQLGDRERVTSDLDESHRLCERMTERTVPELERRIAKILGKARETDPDRQIYNETMCRKIEALAQEAEDAITQFSFVVEFVEDTFAVELERRTRAEAYQQAVLSTLAAVAERERDARSIVKLDEGRARRTAATLQHLEYDDALRRYKQRLAEEEARERQRRAEELAAAESSVAAMEQEGLAEAIRAAVLGVVEASAQQPPSERRGGARFARHIAELVDALAADPTAPGVRMLRNGNEAMMKNFGHPYASSSPEEDGAAEPPKEASPAWFARQRYAAAERVLGTLGYRPKYLESLTTSTYHDPERLGGWTVRIESVPWGRYGVERVLEVHEPNPEVDTDRWLQWHERLTAVRDLLASIATELRG